MISWKKLWTGWNLIKIYLMIMISKSNKEIITNKLKEMGVPIFGFAPVDRWIKPPSHSPNKFREWIPEKFWPQSIFPGTKTVLVIGLPVELPVVETAPSIHYHEHYKTVNFVLDTMAYEISNFINSMGYPSVSIPRDGYGSIDVLLEKPLAFFSHKHAAYLAGLGTFGENNVLLTRKYGPRVRFTSIFISAEVEGDPIEGEDLCIHCEDCVNHCPVNAIKSVDHDYIRIIDKLKCATRSKKLRNEFRSPCGICIKVCPVGEDREHYKKTDTSLYNHSNHKYSSGWEHVKSYGSITKN